MHLAINNNVKQKWLNNPNINGKYNYIYKITNSINGKIYIGVHRTKNLNDNYMGSGRLLKRVYVKYGIENFTKEILSFFDTYKEALDAERELVTVEFIESTTNYNLKEGGYGNCQMSSHQKKMLSAAALKKWTDPEYRDRMMIIMQSADRRQNVSVGVKRWIEDNPEAHTCRMNKINTNPSKISKTADTHRGMIRGRSARSNISNGILVSNINNPEVAKKRSGVGRIYVYNTTTGEVRRQNREDILHSEWVYGSGPKLNKSNYVNMNKGSFFVYNSTTDDMKRMQKDDVIPDGYIRGKRAKK